MPDGQALNHSRLLRLAQSELKVSDSETLSLSLPGLALMMEADQRAETLVITQR